MRATGRGVSKTPTNTTLEPLYYILCNNIPRNTPYGSSYVHGKMGTYYPVTKFEL